LLRRRDSGFCGVLANDRIRAVIFGVQKSHLFPKGALAIEYDYRRRFAREFLWKFFRKKRQLKLFRSAAGRHGRI